MIFNSSFAIIIIPVIKNNIKVIRSRNFKNLVNERAARTLRLDSNMHARILSIMITVKAMTCILIFRKPLVDS